MKENKEKMKENKKDKEIFKCYQLLFDRGTPSKEDKAIIECYQLLFAASTPSADFSKLLEDAEENENGDKVIDFMAYEIGEEKYDEIVDNMIKKYKFKNYKKQQFKTTIALGRSPKFKRYDTN